MNKKKLVIIAIILVAVLGGGILLTGEKSPKNAEEIAKHNEEILANAEKDEANLKPGVISSKDATCEEWLSAAALTAVSMTYPDFKLEGIYAISETDFNRSEESKGIYIKFISNGENKVIYSKPLSEERTEKDTIDLHEEKLGFATFDLVKESVAKDETKEISVDSLENLINKCSLVSLYEHY